MACDAGAAVTPESARISSCRTAGGGRSFRHESCFRTDGDVPPPAEVWLTANRFRSVRLTVACAAAVSVCASTVVAARGPGANPANGSPPRLCRIAAFDGLLTLHARVSRTDRDPRADAPGPSEDWAQFERAATAILGFDTLMAEGAASVERLVTSLAGDRKALVPCDAGTVVRDRIAYRLALAGYSARDIALMLLEQASRADVDEEFARAMAGLGRSDALETRRPADAPAALVGSAPASSTDLMPGLTRVQPPGRPDAPLGVPAHLTGWVRHYSNLHGVDPRLVAAVIQSESGWNVASQSPKGAIGLMQLMPATASMLNVNPRDTLDNIRGGIAYLAGLLRTYGNVRHALIAYNAGPTHANQVIRGDRALYGETQRYLDAIAVLYPLGGEP